MDVDDRVSLHKLRVFELVVKFGGVGRAADHLHVAQPVVSGHIRSLEERLGVKLFYREGRHLQLTQAGHAALSWAHEVQRRTRELDRELKGLSAGVAGNVVVGASMSVGTYILPDLLIQFRKRLPQVQVTLDMPEVRQALEDTESGMNDFSVIGLVKDPELKSLQYELIGHAGLVFVASPGSGFAAGEIDREELADIPFVGGPGRLAQHAYVQSQLAKLGVHNPNVTMQMGHPEAVKQAVRAGLGVAVLFRSAVAHELEAGTLRELHVRDAHLAIPVHVVTRKDHDHSPVQQELMSEIAAHFAPTLTVLQA